MCNSPLQHSISRVFNFGGIYAIERGQYALSPEKPVGKDDITLAT